MGFNVPINQSLMITGSVGYTWRQPFDRERSSTEPNPIIQSLTRLDPGDVVTGALAVAYQDSQWAWSLNGTISEETTTTTENGAALYKAGRRYLATATVSRTWPENWGQTTVTGSYSHSNRNQVRFLGTPAPIVEALNNNSDLFRVGVQHLFPVGETFAFGPTGSYLHRDRNSYNPGTLQFVPAKERWAVGGQARKAITPNVVLNVRGEHVWTREGERPATNGALFSVLANAFVAGSSVPTVSSTGWMVAGGVNVKN
jgi:hypothetical protein